MRALIVFDSVYNNTEKIARAIGAALPPEAVKVVKADAFKRSDLDDINLLIVGSPTQGGRATQNLQNMIDSIPANGLRNVFITAFDTRMTGEKNGFGIRMLVKVFGWAAGRIAETLKSKGGSLIVLPEGFVVEGREGPLKTGEIERATTWGKQIAGKLN